MNVKKTSLNKRELILVDNYFDLKTIKKQYNEYRKKPYYRAQKSHPKDKFPTLAMKPEPEEFVKSDIYKMAKKLVKKFFPKENLRLGIAYVNFVCYGDVTQPHQDCVDSDRDVTVLYYLNPKWHHEWGGEAMFYDADGQFNYCVSAQPGRAIVFRGSIWHKVNTPSRISPENRLAIAFKFVEDGSLPEEDFEYE